MVGEKAMRRWWVWLLVAVGGLGLALIVAGSVIDEPLRRYVERQLNNRLKGYTIGLGKLDLQPWRFTVEVFDLVIRQDANPEPAVLYVPRVRTSLHWRALLSAKVVSDVLVERPQAYLNLKQLREEASDDLPVQKRGWQESLQAVTPIKVNVLKVVDGAVTYVDADPSQPLHLAQLQLRAGNIRNVQSQAGEYPSDLQLRGTIFESGQIWLAGHADFLATPHVAVKAQFGLEHVPLNYAKPVARRANFALRQGRLSVMGEIVYNMKFRAIHLQNASIEGLHLDYLYTDSAAASAPERAQRVRRAEQVAQDVSNAPDLLLRADAVSIVRSEVGFVNAAATPDYRIFLTELEVHLTNFSNQFVQGIAVARLHGQFMGSGETVAGATFRPETEGPNFALAASIENTQVRTMNRLLRAHGKFDVVHGFFSVYSELRVQNGAVRGYVKPLLRELDVYDPRQDREKNLFQQIYEALIGGASKVLENIPRDEVATKAEISGPLENPRASTWQVLVNLIRNAFFQSILPGFEGPVERSSR
jgi:hypothetical protein